MSHIESYKIIEEYKIERFTSEINHALSEGWEMHGPTQVVFSPPYKNEYGVETHDTYFYQAIVKLKEKKSDGL